MVRLRHTLMETTTEWQQRLHALLYHHGVAKPGGELTTADKRRWLRQLELPGSAQQAVRVGLSQIDAARAELTPIDRWLARYAKQHPVCRALMAYYGVGHVTGLTLLAEVGDARRFGNGRAIVRYTGLDITVYASDGKRAPGHPAKQGPETLRWALCEAAKLHSRRGAPEYDLYQNVKKRTDGQRAALTVGRKLARQIRHTLIQLGDDALAPIELDTDTGLPATA
jgi:transposase